jgi:hypothetical protein
MLRMAVPCQGASLRVARELFVVLTFHTGLSDAVMKFQHSSMKRRVSGSETRQYNVSNRHEMDLA